MEKGKGMLLNNVESDLKTRLAKEGITQKELAGQIGVSLPYVNRITKGREQLINSYHLCSASTNMDLLLQRKDHLDLIFIFDTRGNKSLALI